MAVVLWIFVLCLPALAGPDGCGVNRPARLVEAGEDGVLKIEPRVLLDKRMAMALYGWEADLRVAGILYLDEPIAAIEGASGFACRNIYFQAEGRLSHHARGLALDVPRFRTVSGKVIDILEHWGKDTPEGWFLRAARNAACRNFDTVLGPEFNRPHANHFHLDLGGGGTCR